MIKIIFTRVPDATADARKRVMQRVEQLAAQPIVASVDQALYPSPCDSYGCETIAWTPRGHGSCSDCVVLDRGSEETHREKERLELERLRIEVEELRTR